MRNGATWDRFEPRKKLKKVKFKKIWILLFEFCPSFKSVLDSLHFPIATILKNYFLYVKMFFEILKFVWRIFNFQLLYRTLKMIFSVSNNNVSYTQLSSVFFFLQKDSYFDHDDTDVFFLFLLQKDFYICLGPFWSFSFYSSERFWYLSLAFLEAFVRFLFFG